MNPDSKLGAEIMESLANTVIFNPDHQSTQTNSNNKSNGGKGKGRDWNSKLYYIHCNKDGHIQVCCWELYPLLRQNKNKALETKSGTPNFRPDL